MRKAELLFVLLVLAACSTKTIEDEFEPDHNNLILDEVVINQTRSDGKVENVDFTDPLMVIAVNKESSETGYGPMGTRGYYNNGEDQLPIVLTEEMATIYAFAPLVKDIEYTLIAGVPHMFLSEYKDNYSFTLINDNDNTFNSAFDYTYCVATTVDQFETSQPFASSSSDYIAFNQGLNSVKIGMKRAMSLLTLDFEYEGTHSASIESVTFKRNFPLILATTKMSLADGTLSNRSEKQLLTLEFTVNKELSSTKPRFVLNCVLPPDEAIEDYTILIKTKNGSNAIEVKGNAGNFMPGYNTIYKTVMNSNLLKVKSILLQSWKEGATISNTVPLQ